MNPEDLTHGSLFSGIGGFDLAFQRAGFRPLWQVEIEPYAQAVLAKNFPEAKRYGDIRTVHGVLAHTERDGCQPNQRRKSLSNENRNNSTHEAGREIEQSGASCGSCLPTPTVLTGGFPCQPFSVAGKRRGQDDDRFLWPQMLRVIRECHPAWVVAENVRGLVSLQQGSIFEQVLSDLEGIGYEVQPFIVPACAFDAPHRRERVWIIARRGRQNVDDSEGEGWRVRNPAHEGSVEGNVNASRNTGQDVADAGSRGRAEAPHEPGDDEAGGRQKARGNPKSTKERGGLPGILAGGRGKGDVADAADSNRRKNGSAKNRRTPEQSRRGTCGEESRADGWLPEPDVGRVAHGVPSRVDRLKALGNAIVPQIAEWIAWNIRAVEDAAKKKS